VSTSAEIPTRASRRTNRQRTRRPHRDVFPGSGWGLNSGIWCSTSTTSSDSGDDGQRAAPTDRRDPTGARSAGAASHVEERSGPRHARPQGTLRRAAPTVGRAIVTGDHVRQRDPYSSHGSHGAGHPRRRPRPISSARATPAAAPEPPPPPPCPTRCNHCSSSPPPSRVRKRLFAEHLIVTRRGRSTGSDPGARHSGGPSQTHPASP
jgi:hypothetical protein